MLALPRVQVRPAQHMSINQAEYARRAASRSVALVCPILGHSAAVLANETRDIQESSEGGECPCARVLASFPDA